MQNRYQTFWPRFFAGIIDAFIIFPLAFPDLFWDMTNVRTIITVDIAYLILYSVYVIIGHGIYGQTVGKKVMKVRLLDLSENSTIGIFRAFLRESIWIALSIIALIDFSIRTKGTAYITLEQSEKLLYHDWIMFGWLLVEIITMLTNNKRRALHDYIAKSVVIRMQSKRKGIFPSLMIYSQNKKK